MKGSHARLRAIKDGDVLILTGVVDESVDITAFADLVNEVAVVDCKDLGQCSWDGVNKLNHTLANTENPVAIKNLSWGNFLYFRVLPEFDQDYNVLSFELSIFSRDDHKQAKRVLFEPGNDKDKIKALNAKIITFEDTFIAEALADRISLGQAFLEEIDEFLANPWFEEKKEELDFWLNFVSFCNDTVRLSSDIAQGIEAALIHLYRRLYESHNAILSAVQAAGHDVELLHIDLQQKVERTESACQLIITRIDETYANCLELTKKVYCLLISESVSDNVFFSLIKDLSKEVKSLKSVAAVIEEEAVRVNEEIISFHNIDKFRSAFDSLQKLSPELDVIEAFRDKANIMNPVSDGDWAETLNDFKDQLYQFENDLDDSVTISLGFDLLRQILEHRIDEFTMVDGTLDLDDIASFNFDFIQEQVVEHIKACLVTDQEKRCFAYYFPDFQSDRRFHAPGDIMVF